MMKFITYSTTLLGLFSIKSVFGSTTCDDSYDCASTTVTDDYVYCSGNLGCYNSELDISAYLYCSGNYGCYRAVIETDSSDYVYCSGHCGCYQAEIAYAYTMYAYGYFGAAYSKALVSRGYCNGYYSCYGASLSEGSYYYSYGYYAFAYGDIDTDGVTSVYTYLYGYYSGYDTAIYCRNGSTCYVYCSDVGCYSTKLLCYTGATCTTSCDSTCASGCPTTYYVSEAASSLMLEAKNNEEDNINGNVKYITPKEADELINERNTYKEEYKQQEIAKLKELEEKYGIEQAPHKYSEWLDAELSKRIKENGGNVLDIESNVDSITMNKVNNLLSDNIVVILVAVGVMVGILIGACGMKLFSSNDYQKI